MQKEIYHKVLLLAAGHAVTDLPQGGNPGGVTVPQRSFRPYLYTSQCDHVDSKSHFFGQPAYFWLLERSKAQSLADASGLPSFRGWDACIIMGFIL